MFRLLLYTLCDAKAKDKYILHFIEIVFIYIFFKIPARSKHRLSKNMNLTILKNLHWL